MRFAWFVAVCGLALLWSSTRAEAAWYCDPLQAYYPAVSSCPSPWRSLDPKSEAQHGTAPQSPDAGSETPQQQRAAATQGDQPTFAAPSSFTRGDVLDQWCKGSTTALLTAVCGDDDLRALAVRRLYAFEEAKARLTPEQQKELIADQNGWAMSYPQACGLNANVRPSLPLEPPLKDCLAKAGQARLQYLKDYGQTKSDNAATPAATPPPTTPAPASPAPAPQPPSATPIETQPPAAPAVAPPTAPAASQNKEAPPAATATVPPPATPAKPAPGDTGPAATPQRNTSLSKIGDYTRMGSMLIAVIVVAIWAITAWLNSRSRRAGKAAEPPP